eukprot:5294289-Prymnesium_polylepis.1
MKAAASTPVSAPVPALQQRGAQSVAASSESGDEAGQVWCAQARARANMPMQTRRKAPTSATTRYQHVVLAIFEEEPEPAQAGY